MPKADHARYLKAWRKKNKDKAAAHDQRAKQKRLRALEDLAGRPRPDRCEVCDSVARIVWDHCHESGQFRGWLCDRCNLTLGKAKDSPWLLRQLAAYLENHDGDHQRRDAQGPAEG